MERRWRRRWRRRGAIGGRRFWPSVPTPAYFLTCLLAYLLIFIYSFSHSRSIQVKNSSIRQYTSHNHTLH